MEILQFSNNVEVAKLAKSLLTDEDNPYPYAYAYCTCWYRMPPDETKEGEKPRRCIFGRLMYGHIPEDHPFWDMEGSASDAMKGFPLMFEEKFPWMSPSAMDKVQSAHDDTAMSSGNVFDVNWDEIMREAKIADEVYANRNA